MLLGNLGNLQFRENERPADMVRRLADYVQRMKRQIDYCLQNLDETNFTGEMSATMEAMKADITKAVQTGEQTESKADLWPVGSVHMSTKEEPGLDGTWQLMKLEDGIYYWERVE